MSNVLGRCSFAYVISLGILTTMATFDMSLSYDRKDEDEKGLTATYLPPSLSLYFSHPVCYLRFPFAYLYTSGWWFELYT